MAKTGFWLRGAQGKLAGAAIQRGSNGETIIREIVTPANPNTVKQRIQRVIVSTVGHAYSVMKEICDHSFEGKKKGMECMKEFMSFNTNSLRDHVLNAIAANTSTDEIWDFNYPGGKVFAVNEYMIARGSMPKLVTETAVEEGYAENGVGLKLSANTYQAFLDDYGLQRGDQITFVSVNLNAQETAYVFNFMRVILDPVDAEGNQLPMSTAFVADNKVNKPSARNQGTPLGLAWANNLLNVNLSNNDVVAHCAISSRQGSDGKWRYSDGQLRVTIGTGFLGLNLQDAIARANKTSVATNSDLYLHNSGTGSYVTGDGSLVNQGSSATTGGDTGGGGSTGGDNTGDQLP